MSGDFETIQTNQPKITYLKPEDNTEWLDKLINNIKDIKKNISQHSQSLNKKGVENSQSLKNLNKFWFFQKIPGTI